VTPGRCALCGYRVGGAGLLCNQCWRGREDHALPRHLTERLAARMQRLEHFEATGRPWPHHVHRYRVAPQ
jgi:predicted amidophosphoribosyltransferase